MMNGTTCSILNDWLPEIDRTKLDDLHWKLNKLLSHNKPFNSVISERELGKTTELITFLYNKLRQKGTTFAYIKKITADITATTISDLETGLNKFLKEPVQFTYLKGSLKDGLIDVHIKYKDRSIWFFRVMALGLPLQRLKGQVLRNIAFMWSDEFIVNTRLKEKYLFGEWFRFEELFTTLNRESANGIRAIFSGNPYSIYNPYFAAWGVKFKEIYPGNFIVGEKYAIDIPVISPELKALILSKNPLYEFDDSYKKYAFDGRSVNDEQIKIQEKEPKNFRLAFVFYIENQKIGVYFNNAYFDITEDAFWICILAKDYESKDRNIYTFNFNSLVEGTILLSHEEKSRFNYLKKCFRLRRVSFKSVEESYLFEQIFQCI